jgi:hypothetical protein
MKWARWVGLAAAAALWLARPGKSCQLAQDWNAQAPFYDYLNSVSFTTAGRGELVYGDHQVVRTELKFRYQDDGHTIAFAYADGFAPQRIGYAIERGDFVVVEPGPGGETRTRYACRLRFERDPFPPDAYHHPQRQYFACPRR